MSRREYSYCPYCANRLEDRAMGKTFRRACATCGFVHFADPKVAVIGRIEHDGKVLLARRGVDPGRGLWALPGGYMDAGEMPEPALQREIREEVGLEIRVRDLVAIYPMINTGGASLGIVLAYRAEPLEPLATPVAHDDVTEVAWFRPQEVPDDLAFPSTREQIAAWRADNYESARIER